jgi:hypothetical protein
VFYHIVRVVVVVVVVVAATEVVGGRQKIAGRGKPSMARAAREKMLLAALTSRFQTVLQPLQVNTECNRESAPISMFFISFTWQREHT